MKIDLDEVTIEALEKLQERYYFGLFKTIVKDEDEEYQLRDAIIAITKAIEEKRQ